MNTTTYVKTERAALPNTGFDPKFFRELAVLEENNFWFRARNTLILWAINTWSKRNGRFLDIGCGTGFVLHAIAEHFPAMSVTGGELFPEALEFARKRVPSANLFVCDASKMSIHAEFDSIGAFDVLEHIEDDRLAIRNLYAALTAGGLMFITVPQHSWLWSQSDEIVFHHRRYEPGELEAKLSHQGFELIRSTSFIFTLLPLMTLSRIWQRIAKPQFTVFSELATPMPISRILEFVLRLEIIAIKLGINFPVGGSRVIVARKPNPNNITECRG